MDGIDPHNDKQCDYCEGSGVEDDNFTECHLCEGAGWFGQDGFPISDED